MLKLLIVLSAMRLAASAHAAELSIKKTGAETVEVTAIAEPGKPYTLEKSPQVGGDWVPVAEIPGSDAGSTNKFQFKGLQSHDFYRLTGKAIPYLHTLSVHHQDSKLSSVNVSVWGAGEVALALANEQPVVWTIKPEEGVTVALYGCKGLTKNVNIYRDGHWGLAEVTPLPCAGLTQFSEESEGFTAALGAQAKLTNVEFQGAWAGQQFGVSTEPGLFTPFPAKPLPTGTKLYIIVAKGDSVPPKPMEEVTVTVDGPGPVVLAFSNTMPILWRLQPTGGAQIVGAYTVGDPAKSRVTGIEQGQIAPVNFRQFNYPSQEQYPGLIANFEKVSRLKNAGPIRTVLPRGALRIDNR